MALQITLSDDLEQRLHALATSFRDTPEVVINRVLDDYERLLGTARPAENRLRVDTSSDFDLIHSKIESAVMDGITARNWNELNEVAHRLAYRRLKSISKLKKHSLCNLVDGKKHDDGYKPLAETPLSLQGVDSTRAMRSVLKLAALLKVPVDVEFFWRNKPNAAHPGQAGLIEWKP